MDPATVGKVNVLPDSIISGAFDLSDKGLVVGRDYAANNRPRSGRPPRHLFARTAWKKCEATAGKTNAEVALAEDFTVRGIFDVGFPDYNSSIIVTSLEDARELVTMPDNAAQGLQIKLRDPFQADEVAGQLRAVLDERLHRANLAGGNARTFSTRWPWRRNMMFFMLFFIMIVAAFGIVNCQITFVVQKTREIGILKALGASNRQILWFFLSQSVVVGVLGVGLGLGAAMLALHYRNQFLDFMRHVTHSDLLPASIYHVYDLPASIQTADVLRHLRHGLCRLCAGRFVSRLESQPPATRGGPAP